MLDQHRTETAMFHNLLPVNAFETYQAGSGVINVTVPGHGLMNGTSCRFRGSTA